jgi:PAS domain S-box-containing protein
MNQSIWEKCLSVTGTMGEPVQTAQLKMLLDIMIEGVAVYDAGGRVLLANQVMQDVWNLWGVKKAPETQLEYRNRDVLFFNGSRELEPEEELLARVLRGERFSGYEVQVRRPETGAVFYYRCNGLPICDETGKFQGGIVTMLDITRQKQNEEESRASEELRQSEQKYKDLIKYARAGIYEVDFPSNRFRSVNDVICQLTGYTREELLGMTTFDLLDEESKLLAKVRFNQVLKGERPKENVEYKAKSKDGRELFVVLNINFHFDEKGESTGATVIVHDITEEKKIRDELQQRERDLITFIDNIPGFVYFKDLEDRMVFPNQKLCDLCDLTREELIGRSVYEEGHLKEIADKFNADDRRINHRNL